jgi:hypothetical protein
MTETVSLRARKVKDSPKDNKAVGDLRETTRIGRYPTEQEEILDGRFYAILENVFWILMGVFSLWHSDIARVTLVKRSSLIQWPFFIMGVTSFALLVGIFCAMKYWILYERVPRSAWKESAPKAIPLAILLGLVSCSTLVAAYFPLYGWKTFIYFYSFCLSTTTVVSLLEKTFL